MSSPLLQLNHLFKTFHESGVTVEAVRDVSLTLPAGTKLGIIGESGSGKSTLAKLILGIEKPTSGEILFEGQQVGTLLKKDRKNFRKSCQIIMQNPFESFDPLQKIRTALFTVMRLYQKGLTRQQTEDLCIQTLEQYGLTPARDYLNRYPHQLSGGQLQRIAIIRGMIPQPKLLIADEAVSMLDVSVRADIINLFDQVTRSNDTSLIFISHDILTTAYLSDYICVMYLGEVVEYGPASEVLQTPIHPYTRLLISCCGDLSDQIEPIHSGISAGRLSGYECRFAGRCPDCSPQCQNHPELLEVSPGHLVRCSGCIDLHNGI